MGNQSFIRAIDKAAEMCGNSVKLAQRLGVGKSQVSEYRSGKRSVPKHVIEKLAELIDVKPEILWIWAQDMRNPLREGAARKWLVQTGGEHERIKEAVKDAMQQGRKEAEEK